MKTQTHEQVVSIMNWFVKPGKYHGVDMKNPYWLDRETALMCTNGIDMLLVGETANREVKEYGEVDPAISRPALALIDYDKCHTVKIADLGDVGVLYKNLKIDEEQGICSKIIVTMNGNGLVIPAQRMLRVVNVLKKLRVKEIEAFCLTEYWRYNIESVPVTFVNRKENVRIVTMTRKAY